MQLTSPSKVVTVALLGNPNTGKSTLFTALCGVRQRTGNYPGVTIEKKTGRLEHAGRVFDIVDLPGTYSLAPRSPDEMVPVNVLLGREPEMEAVDVAVCIVDASNLERNLYLVSQILEFGLPVVIALNMVDLAASKGSVIDVALMQKRLHVPIVPVQANKGIGIEKLRAAIDLATATHLDFSESPFPAEFQREVELLQKSAGDLPRYLVERLLLDTSGFLQDAGLPGTSPGLADDIQQARSRLANAKCTVPAVEPISRYRWIAEVLDGVVQQKVQKPQWTDRIDRLLTHRVLGLIVFMAVMVAMFAAVFWLATWPMEAIDYGVTWLAELVNSQMEEGALQSLLADGVIAGVGGVLMFLPQILILFLFIGVLEDCGYMARAAYLMDKLMWRVGLSGKSFIPLLSSFACAIPGIMGTRVIENSRDRLATILVAPLMSCSARLPVYTLLAVAFIPEYYLFRSEWFGGIPFVRPLTVAAMYFLGIATAALVALVLKRTLLRGATPPFVMELPMYKFPSPLGVIWRSLERGWAFIKSAGSLILAISILIWAALYYPHRDEAVEGLTDADEISAAYLADSYLGRAGRALEPAVEPLGWDWRIGSAAIASFPAREVVVATLGVIFKLGGDVDEESPTLQAALADATWPDGRKLFTLPVALSLMVFFALCAQCAATLATIKRETNSWRWPLFTFAYMTALAYVAALVTYQVGSRLTDL